jgi:hypothetical protein
MKAQRLALALTAINLMLLLLTAMQARSTTAQTATPILRARAGVGRRTQCGSRATQCERV